MKLLSVLLALALLLAPVTVGFAPGDASPATWDGDRPTLTVDPSADALGALFRDPVAQQTETDGDGTNGSDTTDPTTDSWINVLAAPSGSATSVSLDRHHADLGPASRIETTRTTASMRTEATIAHVQAANSSAERKRRLVAAEAAVRDAETRLYERQQEAIDAHARGELSDRELFVELAEISATAEVLRMRLDALSVLAAETSGVTLETESLAFRLSVYEGPVRSYALETIRGGETPDRIYVETADDVVILAAIDDDEYLREVYRGDRWDRNAAGGPDESEQALERTLSAYPRVDERSLSADTLGTEGLTRVNVPFEGGRLRTFVSGGDGDVFIEHQRRELESFSDAHTRTSTQDGIELIVERTYPGGPVRVTATDLETGDPVSSATVTVAAGGDDSVEVGSTNGEGQLWILSPDRPYRTTVVADPRVAWVSEIDPVDPPRIPEPDDGTEDPS
ncbi:hypothetical protein ACERIT_00330 [Halopenitus sp. H-Gu1]|uniref:DUF7094 domain-containing protein n=1 Tax=Halopenitus sp. H-Gu1 TaxID=3242697 RepID=UPI00359DD755